VRVFTGIDLSEEVKENLERLLAHLRPFAHLHWSAVYNLHITLKFIGEWPEARLDEAEAALRGVKSRPAIPIAIRELGWFPNAHSPRVFWAGVNGGSQLEGLARDAEASLEPLGIARETREYTPHLTLARIKQPAPLQKLQEAIAALPSTEFGSFSATRFYLYRSQPGAAGTIYTKLSEYPFAE
jgi:2'-5' RNA ligase